MPKTFAGYDVSDLDTMGGDEIRAIGTQHLRAMRLQAQEDVERALARLQRATEYLSYRPTWATAEEENLGLIECARVALGEVTS